MIAWITGFWGRSEDLMQRKNEEEHVMIEVRSEGCIYGTGSDMKRYMTCQIY